MSQSAQAPASGNLFIVAAPSGAGKTSRVRELVATDPQLVVSVSHTTRPPRPGETDGQDYHFVDPQRFRALIADNGFLEHAEVFGNLYGTARETVRVELEAGRDVILEIDWQGARQVRAAMTEAIGIFILPPSKTELERRLTGRGQDSAEVIAGRMTKAVAEMSHWSEFDFLVVNDDFAQSRQELATIIAASRLRRSPQSRRHANLIHDLLS